VWTKPRRSQDYVKNVYLPKSNGLKHGVKSREFPRGSSRFSFVKQTRNPFLSARYKMSVKKHQKPNAFVWKSESHKGLHRRNMKLISLRGNQFEVGKSGRSLCRVHKTKASAKAFLETSRYKYKRVRMSSSEKIVDNVACQAASRALHKSIAIATAKYKNKNNSKAKKYCIFFGRFGKCHRAEECPFVHDPTKIAMCTRFLRGKCTLPNCPFSHNASVHKMPVCLFYLQGSCVRENCPYLHVNVNPSAPVCKDFLGGFCGAGEQCKKLHSHVCPSFAAVGSCQRGPACPMLHRQSKSTETLRKQAKKKCVKKQKPSASDSVKDSVDDNVSVNVGVDEEALTPVSHPSSSFEVQPSFISLVRPQTSTHSSELLDKDSSVAKPVSPASVLDKQKITPSFMLNNH